MGGGGFHPRRLTKEATASPAAPPVRSPPARPGPPAAECRAHVDGPDALTQGGQAQGKEDAADDAGEAADQDRRRGAEVIRGDAGNEAAQRRHAEEGQGVETHHPAALVLVGQRLQQACWSPPSAPSSPGRPASSAAWTTRASGTARTATSPTPMTTGAPAMSGPGPARYCRVARYRAPIRAPTPEAAVSRPGCPGRRAALRQRRPAAAPCTAVPPS